jgi:hypothetical protein
LRPWPLGVFALATLVGSAGCASIPTQSPDAAASGNPWRAQLDSKLGRRFDKIVGEAALDCGYVFEVARQRPHVARFAQTRECAIGANQERRSFKVGYTADGGDVIDEFAAGRDVAGQVYLLMVRLDSTLGPDDELSVWIARCDGLEFPRDTKERSENLVHGVGCVDADDLRPRLLLQEER